MIRGLFLLMTALLASDSVQAPPSIPVEKGSIAVSVGGSSERWAADWTMEPSTEQGRPAVHFTEDGHGTYSGYAQPVRWSVNAVWSADGSFYPLRFERTVTDNAGHILATERKTFNPANASVQFERKRDGRPPEIRQLPAPRGTLTVEGIAGILRFLPFEHWRPLSVRLLTNDPEIYDVKIELRGKERIKTPSGEFECYKIELVPELGVLNVVRSFLPKTYMWFAATAPHFWVRYQGPEIGRGTPQIVMELKSYNAPGGQAK
jgi:hypothetical protein